MQGARAHSRTGHGEPVALASTPPPFQPRRISRGAVPAVAGERGPDAVDESKRRRDTRFLWIIRAVVAALLLLLLLFAWIWTQPTVDDHAPARPSLTIFLLPLFLLVPIVIAALFERMFRGEVEASLRATAEDAAFAVEAASLGLWSWTAVDNKVHASARCREMLGLEDGTPCDLSIFLDRVLLSGRARLSNAIEAAIKTNGHFEIEVRVVASAGQIRWLLASGHTKYDRRLSALGLAGSFVDVTERKEAEQDAAAQRKIVAHLARVDILGGLSGAIAHELNQPLAAALSNAQAVQRLLLHRPLDTIEIGKAVSDIVADNARAGEIIRHFRALLKRSEINFKSVDLNEIATLSLDLVRVKLHQQHVRTVLQLAPGSLLINADSIQLQQVLLNLILNASEAMAAHNNGDRALTVETFRDGEWVECVVSDNGAGISPEILARLFEPFWSTKKHGLGLGLSISRSIVVAHCGELRGGNALGRGAEFRLRLPALGTE